MTRDEVLEDIKKTLGSVPGFFMIIPDGYLEHQWILFKQNMFEADRNSPISLKNRELMGVGIAGITGCPYCSYFHTAVAERVHEASEEEMANAATVSTFSGNWSTFLRTTAYPIDTFKKEVDEVVKHLTSK